jgi:hypothetical protein
VDCPFASSALKAAHSTNAITSINQTTKGQDMQDNPTSKKLSNDPSAGSPTETLLRLLLPLNDQV